MKYDHSPKTSHGLFDENGAFIPDQTVSFVGLEVSAQPTMREALEALLNNSALLAAQQARGDETVEDAMDFELDDEGPWSPFEMGDEGPIVRRDVTPEEVQNAIEMLTEFASRQEPGQGFKAKPALDAADDDVRLDSPSETEGRHKPPSLPSLKAKANKNSGRP